MAVCVEHGEEKVASRCKNCRANYQRNYTRKRVATDAGFRERLREASERWAENNPEKRDRSNFRHRLKKYGLTESQYDEMLTAQNGVCAICRRLDGRRLSVDHDHDTGVVRGLLCGKCNLGIGLIASPEHLAAAQKYLYANN